MALTGRRAGNAGVAQGSIRRYDSAGRQRFGHDPIRSGAVGKKVSGLAGAPVAESSISAFLLSGCSRPPEFRLNTEGRDRASITVAQADAVRGAMEDLFGTPDKPNIPPDTGLRIELLRKAAGAVTSDAAGNQFGLFRRHCVTCHGISGDGARARGPPY